MCNHYDDMVLDVAINGNADAIVSNNTRHFRRAAERFDIDLLTPAGLLSKFRKRDKAYAFASEESRCEQVPPQAYALCAAGRGELF
jgi:hypothetical protein